MHAARASIIACHFAGWVEPPQPIVVALSQGCGQHVPNVVVLPRNEALVQFSHHHRACAWFPPAQLREWSDCHTPRTRKRHAFSCALRSSNEGSLNCKCDFVCFFSDSQLPSSFILNLSHRLLTHMMNTIDGLMRIAGHAPGCKLEGRGSCELPPPLARGSTPWLPWLFSFSV